MCIIESRNWHNGTMKNRFILPLLLLLNSHHPRLPFRWHQFSLFGSQVTPRHYLTYELQTSMCTDHQSPDLSTHPILPNNYFRSFSPKHSGQLTTPKRDLTRLTFHLATAPRERYASTSPEVWIRESKQLSENKSSKQIKSQIPLDRRKVKNVLEVEGGGGGRP